MLVDLHMHTYYSDGTMSPEEIVAEGKKKNVSIMAITDHNRIGSWDAFKEAATKAAILPIRGVEINASFGDKVLHILGYGFEPTEGLCKLLEKADTEMERMSHDVIVKLQEEEPRVNIEDYEDYTYDVRKGGWKGIHYLMDRGITERLFEGFKYYRAYGCDFNQYDFPKLSEVCQALKEAGGVSVLAHPASYYGKLEAQELLEVLEAIKREGIDGIECYYPTHTEALTKLCVDFCHGNDLMITTGSDEHGVFGQEAKTLEQTIGCMEKTREQINIERLL
ncbi:MAG: PHP domain-containing protein [Cellulosilyticaceae bacterium]